MINSNENVNENKKDKKNIFKNLSFYVLIIFIILVIYSLLLLTPLIWGLISSLKSFESFLESVISFPDRLEFSNYITVYNSFKVKIRVGAGYSSVMIPEMYLNAILYSVGGAFFATLVPCIVAYCTAMFPYKFSKLITSVVIFCMIMPIIGNLPSEIQVAKALGLYDHIYGTWIMKANFLGMYFLVFQVVFKGLPLEFVEAAKVDGASNLRVFLKIMLPLAKNTFFLVMLILFINFWNDYQVPLIYIPNHPTIAYGVYWFTFAQETELSAPPMKLAGAMWVFIPILIVFVAFRNKLMGNLTIGGIKG